MNNCNLIRLVLIIYFVLFFINECLAGGDSIPEDYKVNQEILGDCLKIMPTLEPNSVDLTVTSPPYDNLRTYNNSLDWGEHIWKPIIKELYRLTKIGGTAAWIVGDATINGDETGTSFRQALHFKEIGFNLHDTMIWIKDGGGAVGSNKCYTQNFEYMFVFSKGSIANYNIIRDKVNGSFGVDKSGVGRRKVSGEHKIEQRKISQEFSRRNNWWYIPTERGDHPAVFPLQLATDHILSWSNKNDVILDPFAGSFTTAIAAIDTNRNYICIEKDETYFNIGKKRIAEHLDKMNSELQF
jgi:DNA modification methylase